MRSEMGKIKKKQREILELKNTIFKMKNSLDECKSRVTEDTAVETIQTEAQRK